MFPVILISALSVIGVRVAGNLTAERRERLLNHLDEFTAVAGVISRLFSAMDGFRAVVSWQHTLMPGVRNQQGPPVKSPTPSGNSYEPSRDVVAKRGHVDDDDWDDYELEGYPLR